MYEGLQFPPLTAAAFFSEDGGGDMVKDLVRAYIGGQVCWIQDRVRPGNGCSKPLQNPS